MTLIDIIPICDDAMSIYTALFFAFGGLAIGITTKRLFMRTDTHDARLCLLEINGAETNAIVKRIEATTNTALSEAQKLNAEVIKHLLRDD